tara:strand:+ start:1947 stop:2957 length:1011 start_codon:yes stop_codon:yes gene_type:complete
MVKLTAVGLRNYIDKTRARRDAREEAIMSIYAKTGGVGLRKIFGSDYRKPDQTADAFNMQDVDTDDIKYSSSKAQSQALALKRFGMSEEAIARFAASGDPTVFERLLKIVNNQRKLYEGEGLKMPEEIITQIVEESTISGPASSGRINIPAIEKYIGRELDTLYKGVLEQQDVTAGSVTLFEPTFVESVTPSDITSAINLYSDGMRSKALREKRLLLAEKSRLNKIEQKNRTEFENTQITLLSTRLARIDEIFKMKVEDQSFAFADLYGNSWIRGFIEENPKYKVKNFPTIYTDAMNIYPQVSSDAMGLALLRAGVFEDGTIVQLPDGETVRLSIK